MLLPGDARDEAYCTSLVDKTVDEFGGLEIVVLNAAYQENRDGLENLPTPEFDRVFQDQPLQHAVGDSRAAIPHLQPGSSIITTSSIQAFDPSPNLIDYAMTKALKWPSRESWRRTFRSRAFGQGHAVCAPGRSGRRSVPAASYDRTELRTFGQDTPLGRAGQPARALARVRVHLAGGLVR